MNSQRFSLNPRIVIAAAIVLTATSSCSEDRLHRQPVGVGEANQQLSVKAQALLTPAGQKPLPFELAPGGVYAEVVNGRVNLAIRSTAGLIFQLTGLPTIKSGKQVLRSTQYRALLLNHPFSRTAATDDQDAAATLKIVGTRKERQFHVTYGGVLRSGSQRIDATVSFLVTIPKTGQDVETTPDAPEKDSE